jgi:hypothetical protein
MNPKEILKWFYIGLTIAAAVAGAATLIIWTLTKILS